MRDTKYSKIINSKLDQINNNKSMIVYGAGQHTEKLFKYYNLGSKNILALVDQKIKRNEQDIFFGYSVYSPYKIKDLEPDIVIISSFAYQENIKKFLLEEIKYQGKIIVFYDQNQLIPFSDCDNYIPKQPRYDDIYLVSYPKSGNSWLSFLVANVINSYLGLNMIINFNSFTYFVPDIHDSREIPEDMGLFPFRRVIKSHSSYNFYYKKVFLLVRNPEDVIVSYYYYLKNLRIYNGSILNFVNNEKYGIHTWVNHTKSWLDNISVSQKLYIITFEDLKKNPKVLLKKIFTIMGFKIKEIILENSIKLSNLSNMKKIEKLSKGYSMEKYSSFEFVRKGEVGEGLKELSNNNLRYIENITKNIKSQLDLHKI